MPYTPVPFSTTAVISSATKFSQYPPEIQKLMADVSSYLINQISLLSASYTTGYGYTIAQEDLNMFGLQSNNVLTGGGTITVSATWYVLWSTRFIPIGNGNGATSATVGFFDISCPTTGTIIGVGGAANKTATAAGIPLASYETLYYILPLGSANTSLAANFRVVGYTSTVVIPPNWIKICVYNSDGQYVEFANNISLRNNSSINTALYDVLASDVSGLANVYALLASPTFIGVPLASTAAVDTNTTQIATTAFILGQASATPPLMNGAATIGVSKKYARDDHIHPADTTKATLNATPAFSSGLSVGNVAQAGATVLDWYEEGTFTPVIAGLTLAGVGTYTVQLGSFTRIGNRVHFNITLTITAHTGTGQMVIKGLPYVSNADANNYGTANIGYMSLLTYAASPCAWIVPSSSQISLWTAATAAAALAMPIDVAFTVTINGSYQV